MSDEKSAEEFKPEAAAAASEAESLPAPSSTGAEPTQEGAAAPPPDAPATDAAASAQPSAASTSEGAAAKVPALQGALDAFRDTNQTAFVVGHTGECGKALVQELARTKIFSKVFLIGRREVTLEGDVYKDFAVEQKVVDFDNLDASADVFKGPTVGYCCLGTTRGKAGKAGFVKVDHDYVMKVGELAKQNGCHQYHLISSTGANKDSSLLYPKVKGQVEAETADLGFEKYSIYRPGLLMCKRKEFRFGEWIAQGLMKPVDYLSPGSATNTVVSVGQAMIARTVKPAEESKVILGGKDIYRASQEVTG